MEKVQFQLEATLPELKDLYEKGLFAKNEIDQITKRRTAYETSLIRQKTRKEDFFKYAEYEINLERLRKVRWRRLKYHLNPPPPSASTYSLPRRASYILKRATVKFPGDLAVWLAYVEYASREGMRKVVLKGLNSALHHHPLSPTLYLLLSYHHLHPNAAFPGSAIPSTSKLDLPSAGDPDDDDDDTNAAGFSLEGTASARTNILLGIRMIPKSHDLWREYIKLELGWVEGLRRRWQVLGVNIEPKSGPDGEVDPDALTGGEGSFGPDGEDARKSILSGKLVIHALNSALTAIPATEPRGMEFRQDLLVTLRIYPSALRSKCLDVVYDDLRQISSSSSSGAEIETSTKATARFAVVTKELYDRTYEPERKDEGGVVLEGADLVDALGRIAKEIRTVAKSGQYGEKWLELSGEWLVQQISQCGDNADLRQYLFSILTTLTKAQYKPPASLLCSHLEALRASPADATTVLETARAHCAQYPSNPILQRARLELERAQSTDVESIRKAFKSAMKSIAVPDLSTEEEIAGLGIWESYLDFEEGTTQSQSQAQAQGLEKGEYTRLDGIYRKVLRDTLRQTAITDLHDYILVKYLDFLIRHQPTAILANLERITQTYRPNQAFFSEAFDTISERSLTPLEDLRVAYRLWRAASLKSNVDKVEATLHWAEWLLDNKHGKEAGDAVDVMRREVGQDEHALAALERGWASLLDNAERHPGSIDESDESEGEGEGEDEDVEMD